MKTTLGFYLICFVFFCNQDLMAQLTVANGGTLGMTPAQLVQNWLVGPGVIISNVTYNGSSAIITSNQVGSFNATGGAMTQLGLDAGLIMTNGTASIAIGPNNSSGAGYNTNGPGDPDLTILAGGVTYDKAVIEFDFVSLADTVKFNYAFGSEEFYEFCYQFNDAFGFFLSGPGITGPFSNNSTNIALMPGSSNPVTINNICANPSSAWDNTGGTWFQYDAITYVYTARHHVTPFSTYHIKLAIADALDHILDAGVFLRKGSFSSASLSTQVAYQMGNNAIEGCADATVHFTLSAPAAMADTIHFTIGGTALNCVDYTCIPTSVIIPAGQTSSSLLIHALSDNLTEGTETVILNIQTAGPPGNPGLSDTVYIADYIAMSLLVSNDTVICAGDSVTIYAVPQGGAPPFHYLWSNGATTQSCVVHPPNGVTHYMITVTDTCGHARTDTIRVTANLPVPPYIKGNNRVCAGDGYLVYYTAPGMIGYSWAVSPGGVIISGLGTFRVMVNWTLPGNRWVSVSYSNPGGCAGNSSGTMPVQVYPLPVAPGDIRGDSLLCAGTNGVHFVVSPVMYATAYQWLLPAGVSIVAGDGSDSITVDFGPGAQSGFVLVKGINPCGEGPPSPAFSVTLTTPPFASAGPAGSTCNGIPFNVTQATASNFRSILWTSTGTGTMAGETTLTPVYHPGLGETGQVWLTLRATGNAPCGFDTSGMVIQINPLPGSSAGPDMASCDTMPVKLSGAIATFAGSLHWISSGSGSFDDPGILEPVYTPSRADVVNGRVVLTLVTLSAASCPPASDSLVLHLAKSPAADAGPPLSSCGPGAVNITGASAKGYATLFWKSSGSGFFSDPTVINPSYTPGTEDLQNGQVVLTLVAGSGSACNADSSHTLLTLQGPAEAYAGPDDSVCRNSSYIITRAYAKNYTAVNWLHDGKGTLTGSNTLTPAYTPAPGDPATITLTLIAGSSPPCMDFSAHMRLSVLREPAVDAGPDQSVTSGTTARLLGMASGGSGQYLFDWEPAGLLADPLTREPETVKLSENAAFVLQVTDKVTGCRSSDSIVVRVEKPGTADDCLVFYNVITPNGDGTNDAWIIECVEQYPENSLVIFNRWGEEVHSFQNYNNTSVVWKGTNKKGDPLPDGTYYFIFTAREAGSRTGWILVRGN